jgi:L-fucose isomerase-like protein
MARRRTVIRRRRRRIIVGGALVLAGGAVAYKLGTRDAERIENHTGKPVEDLSDEELERSMDELGIEKQTVREEDVAKLEAQGETGGEVPSASYLDELE